VINLSLGLPQDSPDLRDACQRAADSGCLLVAAVGNDGQNVLYPAGYSSVVGVAAVDGEFDVTAYSAPGDGVAIAAPGGLHVADRWLDGWMDGVLSCVRDETGDEPEYAHHYLVGTSQAAPHVAGAAALMLSANPGLLPSEVRTLLRASALDRGAVGDDVGYGAGVLQVHRAVNLALSANGTPRQDPPTLFLPTTSLNFDGFRSTSITYLYNGGSGQLQPTDVLVETDDGFPWLSATLLDSSRINPPVTRDRVQVDVNRFIVPPGRYAGVVRIRSAAGVLGTIRVVMQVGGYTRLGMPITVSALERDSLIARGEDVAVAERSYRYFVRGMPANDYLLRGGEDFDGDGFLCESFEACGWHDSPLQEEAVAVPFVPGVPAVRGLRVMLAPQQP
jgi:serine protease